MRAFELIEGKHDPHIFKAIFLAGGPGSGKSYVVRKIHGGTGLRIVNPDDFFTMLAKKSDEDLGTLPGTAAGNLLHDKSSELARNKLEGLIKSRIGVIIDGTGRDYNRIKNNKVKLEQNGYDTIMILVNTDLETAKKRNAKRERKINIEFLEASHYAIQNNIGKFQLLFGSNFIVVDNSEDTQTDFDKLWKSIKRWTDIPVKNEYTIQWMKAEK